MDEARTVGKVVSELARLKLDDIVVVANGCSDSTAEAAREAGARLIETPHPLGHDVGRAIGAAGVDADAYLFTDADIILPASAYVPFLSAACEGVDVALNDLDSRASTRARAHIVNICKQFLNTAMGLTKLGINSLTAVPHCLSRKAIETVGWQNLAVPPKAMVLARLAGLKIEAVSYVNVSARNRIRPKAHYLGLTELDELILGDHAEALDTLLRESGARAGLTDLDRNRAALDGRRLHAMDRQAAGDTAR